MGMEQIVQDHDYDDDDWRTAGLVVWGPVKETSNTGSE
jgi:hypothetical protein